MSTAAAWASPASTGSPRPPRRSRWSRRPAPSRGGPHGGEPGDNCHVILRPGTDAQQITGGVYESMGADEVLVNNSGGGGGWGDPLRRAVDAVLEDVREGYVSPERARTDYGVVDRRRGDGRRRERHRHAPGFPERLSKVVRTARPTVDRARHRTRGGRMRSNKTRAGVALLVTGTLVVGTAAMVGAQSPARRRQRGLPVGELRQHVAAGVQGRDGRRSLPRTASRSPSSTASSTRTRSRRSSRTRIASGQYQGMIVSALNGVRPAAGPPGRRPRRASRSSRSTRSSARRSTPPTRRTRAHPRVGAGAPAALRRAPRRADGRRRARASTPATSSTSTASRASRSTTPSSRASTRSPPPTPHQGRHRGRGPVPGSRRRDDRACRTSSPPPPSSTSWSAPTSRSRACSLALQDAGIDGRQAHRPGRLDSRPSTGRQGRHVVR